MKCPNCGQNIADDCKFCPQCGTALYRTYENYNSDRMNMFFMSHNDKFPEEQMPMIRERLLYLDDNKWSAAYAVQYKDPLIALLISVFVGEFGVDRFYLGQNTLGLIKLFTCGGCGVWAIVDLFLIMKAAREENANNLLQAIEG